MDGLKQRIIGALVLVSLAVIFVPMVFDEPHSERTSTTIKIPEEPPFPEVTAPESDREEPPEYSEPRPDNAEQPSVASEDSGEAPDYRLVEEDTEPFSGAPESEIAQESGAAKINDPAPRDEPAEQVATEPAPEPSTGSQSKESESAEFTRSLDGAYVVQLGSFGNADNARRLRDQVRDKGYGSHLQKVERGDTTLTRVFSGPFSSKSDAEAAKRDLDESFSLNSLVTTGDK
ncbi:SPOR domain-containing protein [Marinobacter similis]|uniref:Sporulation protein n=1 Tax=Marinobacter similis TaxID=1420916 RepID=W5YF37_9GAMM|nr:SPOR domain-containing protein [Marinobacter similis]AHI27807.1 sporulation protein [Marinobacter similis]